MTTPKRREFIPALRERICKFAAGFPAAEINKAIDNWRDGLEAQGPVEHGTFAVCDEIAEELDKELAKLP